LICELTTGVFYISLSLFLYRQRWWAGEIGNVCEKNGTYNGISELGVYNFWILRRENLEVQTEWSKYAIVMEKEKKKIMFLILSSSTFNNLILIVLHDIGTVHIRSTQVLFRKINFCSEIQLFFRLFKFFFLIIITELLYKRWNF